jgi:peptidyl-prolyl cis-trans isomerase A (cyclophilin A)
LPTWWRNAGGLTTFDMILAEISATPGGEHRMRRCLMRRLLVMLASLVVVTVISAAGQPASPLLNPRSETMQQTAPATFKAKFETSKGDVIVEVERDWAPNGADRFYNLVKNGFYDTGRFFRVISGFMAQFGISGDPQVSAVWRDQRLKDDPVKQSNKRGFISYAMAGPNTRTTQLFINYGDNSRLDQMGFAPFGRVAEGMQVVDQLYAGYGEGAPQGKGPNQARIQAEGNDYLVKDFAQLDYIKRATIMD